MSSLADVLKATGRTQGRGVEVYEGLEEADRAVFRAALEDSRYTYADIARGLGELGHEITVSQLKEFTQKIRHGGYEL